MGTFAGRDLGLGEFEYADAYGVDAWWDRYSAGEFITRHKNPSTKVRKESKVTQTNDREATERVDMWLINLGRKVEVTDLQAAEVGTDVAQERIRHAEAYARNYTGDFEFMVSMKSALERFGQLTSGQAKGTLNCLRADLERSRRNIEQAPKADAAKAKQGKVADVPAGRYAIDENGELHFFQVDHGKKGSKWEGFTFLSIQASDDTYPIRDRARKATILETIAADPMAASARYGQELGRCGVCGATLTDAESRARGIGPVCAERF